MSGRTTDIRRQAGGQERDLRERDSAGQGPAARYTGAMSRMLFLRDIDVDVLMRCRACGHEGTLPRLDLERRFGPGYPVLSLAPHFRCSTCNSRDVESRPVPTPEGPMLESMVDKAAAVEVEDRFQSTLAALRGLVDAAHAPGGGEDDRDGDRDGGHRDRVPFPPPSAAAPRFEPPPLGSMMDALNGLTAGLEEAGDDGDEGEEEGAPVMPPGLDPSPGAVSPAARQEQGGATDFLKELERISRLMGEDGPAPPPVPAAVPAPAAAAQDDDEEDWLPALFREDAARHRPPVSEFVPPEDEEDEDVLDLTDGGGGAAGDAAPGPDDDAPADEETPEDDSVGGVPPPAYLTDTMAALRSLIQSAARDGKGGDADGGGPVPPPARPDFGYRDEDDEDEADLGLPEPAFGAAGRDSGPASDQDISALRKLVEKAEQDADRSTSAADIASVIPPDFRPPFWVETGLDRAATRDTPAPAQPAPPVPAAAPPPAPEPPRRKGSFLSRLRRRRPDSHHDADAPPPPAPTPEPPPAPVSPPLPDPEPSDQTLDQRLAALKALLAGDEAAPATPPPPAAARPDWDDDDDILDLDAFAEEEPAPPKPAPAPAEEDMAEADFRRILFTRLHEEEAHPSVHPPAPAGVREEGEEEEDIPVEDILSFAIRDRAHEDSPPPKAAARPPEPEAEADREETEGEGEPAEFGRFAIRDPDVLFARSHPEDDEPPPSYLWDEPAEPPVSAPKAPPPEPPPAASTAPAAGPRPDAESYARTLAALRGILGARGTDEDSEGSDPPRGGRKGRRKKAI